MEKTYRIVSHRLWGLLTHEVYAISQGIGSKIEVAFFDYKKALLYIHSKRKHIEVGGHA